MEKRIGSLRLFPGRQCGRSNPSHKSGMLLLCVRSASQTCLCNCGCDKCQTESRMAAPGLTLHGCLESFVQGPPRKPRGSISKEQGSVLRGHLWLSHLTCASDSDAFLLIRQIICQLIPKEHLFLYLEVLVLGFILGLICWYWITSFP